LNLLRVGALEAAAVDTEVITIEVVGVITKMTAVVADEVILEAIVIPMTGRSEERRTEQMASRTIITNATEDTSVMEIARAVVVVGDEMMGVDATMIEIASAKTGKPNNYEVMRLVLTER